MQVPRSTRKGTVYRNPNAFKPYKGNPARDFEFQVKQCSRQRLDDHMFFLLRGIFVISRIQFDCLGICAMVKVANYIQTVAFARKRNDKRKYTIDLSVSTTTSGILACAHFLTVGFKLQATAACTKLIIWLIVYFGPGGGHGSVYFRSSPSSRINNRKDPRQRACRLAQPSTPAVDSPTSLE